MKSESHDGKNERDGNVFNFEDIKNVLYHPDRVNEHYNFEREISQPLVEEGRLKITEPLLM